LPVAGLDRHIVRFRRIPASGHREKSVTELSLRRPFVV
jgi:hypothetical protein